MDQRVPPHGPRITSVLLVEDDPAFYKIVQVQLEKFRDREFQLTWKKSVDEATVEIRNSNFDIILTDYTLPGSNGLELCLQLNQMGCQIPIVFVTAEKDFQLAVEAMKLGVEDFLVKDDLNESLLLQTILRVLDRVKTRKQIEAVEKRMLIAEKRSEAIRELVVTVCHEFNNPLAAIKISADLVQRQPLSKEEKTLFKTFEEHFQQIEMEIKRLRDISFEKFDFQSVKKSDDSGS